MSTELNISKLIAAGKISTELDFERALIADRKLRVLAKKDSKYQSLRKQLRGLISAYESQHWDDGLKVDELKVMESDLAEVLAEKERLFIEGRKALIRSKLKELGLKQQEFGVILGHQSKSYVSELMNGISPFSLKDLILIHRLLKIELKDLVPTFLPMAERKKILSSIQKLDKPNLSLNSDDFTLV